MASLKLATVSLVLSQGIAVTNASLLHKDGDLLKAKDQIDKATVHEKTSLQAKTWYYRGVIYMDMVNSADSTIQKAAPDGVKQAVEAFDKVRQLDKPNGEYVKLAESRKINLWATALNKGINQSKKGQNTQALESYELAQRLRPENDTAYISAAGLAAQIKDYTSAKKYYAKLAEITNDPIYYSTLIWVLQNVDKDYTKALEVAEQGLKKYPNNTRLMDDQINLYIATNKIDEAKAKMEEAIVKNPKNALLYYNLGTIYDKKGDEAKAKEYYNKSLEIDAENFDANFNLGAWYYNKAAKLINEVNKMTLQVYQKEGKKKEDEYTAILKESLPFMEKAYKLKPQDESVKKILRDLYKRLKMTDKENSLN